MEGTVRDNAHDTISWDIRDKLRPLNIPPEVLYKQHKMPVFARPVLGRSLITNHILPWSVNETTIKKRHDLLAAVSVKEYSQKNGLAMSRGEKILNFKDPGTSSKNLLMTESPSWEPITTVSELVDALMAWQTLDKLIHPGHYGTDVIVWIVKKVISLN